MSDSAALPATVADLLAGYPVIVTQAVVWGDMDSYQHVNNVVYFRYFENARLEYFRRLDWFEYEKQTGIGPILAATQALDLRGPEKAGPVTRAAHDLVRSRVPFMDGDRRMDDDIRAVADLIRSGELSRVARAGAGPA